MKIEQFVMAYGVEQDRLRAIMPDGFASLRPVLRVNAEILDGSRATLELNTAAEWDGIRGWLNVGRWENVSLARMGQTVTFTTDMLELSFAKTGVMGSCPAEKDNAGCWFWQDGYLRAPERIDANKQFCDCRFRWLIKDGASGQSIGKTLPAAPTEAKIRYPRLPLTAENAAVIPSEQVLGAYVVEFER